GAGGLAEIPGARQGGAAAGRDGREVLVKVADDVVAVDGAGERAMQHLLDGGRRRRISPHDVSSFDSRPSHSPSSTRRDSRSARIPVAVTVKYRRARPPRSGSGSPIVDRRQPLASRRSSAVYSAPRPTRRCAAELSISPTGLA